MSKAAQVSPHHLINVPLDQLRPTQITVGLAEVAAKREEWHAIGKKARKTQREPWFPCVLGPKGRYYIVDHHHLGLALQEAGFRAAWLVVLRDYAALDLQRFWRVMEFRQWAHPYDAKGRRREYADIPTRLSRLQDDPYRSLAGFVRRGGGYAKDATPFAEFLWADFFRPQFNIKQLQQSFGVAVKKGIALARSDSASYLPGWTGVARSS